MQSGPEPKSDYARIRTNGKLKNGKQEHIRCPPISGHNSSMNFASLSDCERVGARRGVGGENESCSSSSTQSMDFPVNTDAQVSSSATRPVLQPFRTLNTKSKLTKVGRIKRSNKHHDPPVAQDPKAMPELRRSRSRSYDEVRPDTIEANANDSCPEMGPLRPRTNSASAAGDIKRSHRSWKKTISLTSIPSLSFSSNEDSYSIRNANAEHPQMSSWSGSSSFNNSERGGKYKKYRVLPSYAYPNQYMTSQELELEMMRTSSHFHDLRNKDDSSDSEPPIGSFYVEVLSCTGLPKLDRFSDTDPVVYLVCGCHAFCTDVIDDCNSPRWPCKSRRACIFPLNHAYARCYVGVFDDDGDFAGRVVIDIASLRPRSMYDVSLPLRETAHLYTRRPRGMVRLRFHLTWEDETAAVMSYLPVRQPSPAQSKKPVTVACADKMAFRSVALTVHGIDLHGKFSKKIMRATSREMQLYKIHIKHFARRSVKDISMWVNPMVSAYVLWSWMHCVYTSSVGLAFPYGMGFIVLCMMRNYVKYVIGRTTHMGYTPLSILELLLSLIFGARRRDGKGRMKPLTLPKCGSMSSIIDCRQDRSFASRLCSLIGILDEKGICECGGNGPSVRWGGSDHAEFPFSDGQKNRKMSRQESIVTQPSLTSMGKVPVFTEQSVEISSDEEDLEDDSIPLSRQGGDRKWNTSKPKRCTTLRDNIRKKSEPKGAPRGMIPSHAGVQVDSFASDETNSSMPQAKNRTVSSALEQNMDVKGFSTRKSIIEDLAEMKGLAHRTTLGLFQDQVFTYSKKCRVLSRTDSNGVAGLSNLLCGVGIENDTEIPDEQTINQSMERILGIGVHRNPMMGAAERYVSPVIQIMRIGLFTVRAIFNLFMWRDPFISFWFLVFCIASIAVLIVFPWRLFMFLAGVGFVGPQNWVLRRRKQRKQMPEASLSQSSLSHSNNQQNGKEQADIEQAIAEVDKPFRTAFVSHNPSYSFLNDSGLVRKADAQFTREVVVPYSPIKQERFYDWPPEPSLSTVASADNPMQYVSFIVNNIERGSSKQDSAKSKRA